MLPRHHRVVLVDLAADRVLVREVAEQEWPSVADLREAAGDPTARPVSAPVRRDDGLVLDVLLTGTTSADDGRDWQVPNDSLATVLAELRTGGPVDDGPDWWRLGWAAEADACLAHPYLDGRHLATSVERSVGPDAAEAVRAAYVDVWRAAYPDVDHDRAWELAHVADRAFTLVSYEGIYAAQRPADRCELGGIADDIRAEVLALRPRRREQ